MDEELFVIPGAENKAMIGARRTVLVNTAAKLNEKQHSDVPPEDRTPQGTDGESPVAEKDETLRGPVSSR
ncbi:MAG TPA: hypothetical protein VF614_03410 [Chthoniobacteraceae bacterium]|jgi:hypothetical protein